MSFELLPGLVSIKLDVVCFFVNTDVANVIGTVMSPYCAALPLRARTHARICARSVSAVLVLS